MWARCSPPCVHGLTQSTLIDQAPCTAPHACGRTFPSCKSFTQSSTFSTSRVAPDLGVLGHAQYAIILVLNILNYLVSTMSIYVMVDCHSIQHRWQHSPAPRSHSLGRVFVPFVSFVVSGLSGGCEATSLGDGNSGANGSSKGSPSSAPGEYSRTCTAATPSRHVAAAAETARPGGNAYRPVAVRHAVRHPEKEGLGVPLGVGFLHRPSAIPQCMVIQEQATGKRGKV